jgi:hypothetical protein
MVFPEPGDPLKRKPLLGGTRVIALKKESLRIRLNSSDYSFW